MVSAASILMIAFVALSSLLLHGAVAGDQIICEQLPAQLCAYSISDAGKRCVLEKNYGGARKGMVTKYQCKTSEVVVDAPMKGWIETEACVDACGVDRNAVGISSDYLLSSNFVAKLCSPSCSGYCPNILDLYSNLAQAEGMDLHGICSSSSSRDSTSRRRRALYDQPKSSGVATAAAGGDCGAMGTGSPLSSPAFSFEDDGSIAAFAPSANGF